ncbi:MAG TPA: MarR family winged helix-turn-helix transcriptional regulator [Sphingomonas sp.]
MGKIEPHDFRVPAADSDLVAYARFQLKMAGRRARAGSDLRLASAQWNILLDLYISAFERRTVPTGDACLASNAPHSTGLRHVIFLMESGYVTRVSDPEDARRTLVGLTNAGLDLVGNCLRTEYEALTAVMNGHPVV